MQAASCIVMMKVLNLGPLGRAHQRKDEDRRMKNEGGRMKVGQAVRAARRKPADRVVGQRRVRPRGTVQLSPGWRPVL